MYPYPAHAHAAAQAYGPAEQHLPPAPVHAAPGWYPASPHDPWAHMRAYAPPAPSYAPHYPYPPVQAVVYVPMPAHHAAPAAPVAEATDRRTDAAIEEIRQSLRALREAIEDFADDRYGG